LYGSQIPPTTHSWVFLNACEKHLTLYTTRSIFDVKGTRETHLDRTTYLSWDFCGNDEWVVPATCVYQTMTIMKPCYTYKLYFSVSLSHFWAVCIVWLSWSKNEANAWAIPCTINNVRHDKSDLSDKEFFPIFPMCFYNLISHGDAVSSVCQFIINTHLWCSNSKFPFSLLKTSFLKLYFMWTDAHFDRQIQYSIVRLWVRERVWKKFPKVQYLYLLIKFWSRTRLLLTSPQFHEILHGLLERSSFLSSLLQAECWESDFIRIILCVFFL